MRWSRFHTPCSETPPIASPTSAREAPSERARSNCVVENHTADRNNAGSRTDIVQRVRSTSEALGKIHYQGKPFRTGQLLELIAAPVLSSTQSTDLH